MENLFGSKELRHVAARLPVSAKLFFVAMLVTAVLPFKSIAQVPNQTVNNGAATAPVKFPVTGCIYNWANNMPGIGLPAGGTGDITSFSAVNTGTSPVTATITATPKGPSYAYITNQESHNVSVINLATNTVVATIPVGGEPFDVAFSPDGSRAYVVYDGFVAVINATTNAVIANIATGNSPLGIVVSPDGSKAYVANAGDNTISVIQTSTNTVSATIPCSGGPYGLAINADGTRLYSANVNSNTMAVINTGTNAVINTINVGTEPEEVLLSPDGSKIYVNGSEGTISVINNGSLTVGATISSSSGLGNFSISPDGNRLYATEFSDVAVIDAATNSIITKIPTGQEPAGLSVSNDGGWLYVENAVTNSVQVYNTANYTEFVNIPVGTAPITLGSGKFISPAPSCPGSPITFTITVNPGVYAQAPTITYSSHQTFITDALIGPLVPAGNGVAAMGYSSTPVVIGSGFTSVYGVASDLIGNVYITDRVSGQIKKVPATGGSPVVMLSGIVPQLIDIAVDTLGNIFFTDATHNAHELAAGSPKATTVQFFIQTPWGVAADNNGQIFVADNGRNQVDRINIATFQLSGGSTDNLPTGVAVDAADRTYIASEGTNTSIKGPVGNIGSGFNQANGVAVDFSGNVYVADQGNNAVKMVAAGSNTPVAIGSGFSSPTGVAVDGAGNVYVADNGNNQLKKISPVGGYFISPTLLPPGLSFNNNTGIISGTPTGSFAAKKYTITAYNSFGSASAPVIIAIQNNVNLASLSIQQGTLSPAFSASVTKYSTIVDQDEPVINLSSATIDATSSIKVGNGKPALHFGNAVVYLHTGLNIVPIVVTGKDGLNSKTYTLYVTRGALTANADLASLTVGGGSHLTPYFSPLVTSYTDTVAYNHLAVTITPTANDPLATITVNGTAVASGATSASIPLNEGPNTITTIVTAEDGVTTKTDTITVFRAFSSDANLSTLGQSLGPLTPAFSSATISYTINTTNANAAMTLKPVSSDANATIKVNGTAVTSGIMTSPIALAEGAQTVITTVVIAQDGVTTKTYTLTVTRAPSAIAALSSLKLSNGTLSPAFATATTTYTASVANTVSTMTITPTAVNADATIKVNGTSLSSGTASTPIALAEGGQTVITTVVTAQDGSTAKTYSITVTRAVSANANLATLGQSILGLTPAFATGTTSYTINTGNAIASMTLKPVSSDAHAAIKVDGATVASGTLSGPIALAPGPNTITTTVTAQNGTTTKTYTLTVTRASGGADSYVPIAIGTDISVTKPTETPQIADDGLLVHQGISPNGDGINDFLQIDNISQYPNNKLAIMNRNGQLIFETQGYDNSSKVFDGHSNKNGQMQLPGTYFYQLDYAVNGIIKHKTGFIVLKY